MKLSEQNEISELEYYHCSRCGCKLDDPNNGEEIIGDGIYCGEYYKNCKMVVRYVEDKQYNNSSIV